MASLKPTLVQSGRELQDLVSRMDGAARVAVDTEAASFHRYRDRVYLIQLSTDTETAIVDPLTVDDLSPLRTLLAAPAVEIVFHDADYDLRTLDRDYGFRARHLFDTRIAAQFAGEAAIGLGALLEKFVHVKLNKKHQRADWSQRPLPDDMIRYAAADTHYLLTLRDILEQRLTELGRLAWVQEEFERLEHVRWTGPTADEENSFLRMKGAKALRGPALAVLKAVYEWRDAKAESRDRAPFRILGNAALLGLAKARPTRPEALGQVADLPAKLAHRYGPELLTAVQAGLTLAPEDLPDIPRPKRRPHDPAYDARLDRLKTLRNRCATALGLDPGLVCPSGTLEAIARAEPADASALAAIDELRAWQRGVLGEKAILRAVAGV